MAAADPRIRQIKIKTGVLKRLTKELNLYIKETAVEEEKLEKMKVEPAADDDAAYMIKKQGEILQESRMMIPDCKKRVIAAHGDLTNVLEAEEELKEAEEYQAAKTLLEEVKLGQ